MRRDSGILVRSFTLHPETNRPMPDVPNGWEVETGADGWVEVYPDGRGVKNIMFHALLCTSGGSPGAWAVFGARAVIQRLLDLVTNSWDTLGELRADNGVVATQVKAAWIVGTGTTIRRRIAGFLDDDAEQQP